MNSECPEDYINN